MTAPPPSAATAGPAEATAGVTRVSVGLEQGPDGAVHVHALNLPGLVSSGPTQAQALSAFPGALRRWADELNDLSSELGSGAEIHIEVDEWVESGADVGAGRSEVCFSADTTPLTAEEIEIGLRWLGTLRGRLLARIRKMRGAALEAADGTGVGVVLDELARAQWWTLTRLGASPLAEVPDRVVARLDTAMVLVVREFTNLQDDRLGGVLELDGELWTPRKVLRRLLWLESMVGGAALELLDGEGG